TLRYDNLVLDNAKGTVSIKDEAATLSNITSSFLGGKIGLNGSVSTKKDAPTFAMKLDLQQIDIDQSFGQLELLKYLAPIAKALDGNLNTTLNLTGALNNNLTPDLKTIAGSALAQIITAEVNPQQAPLLSKLGEQVTFLNVDKLSLQDVRTILDFSDGNISVQPFDFKVDDIIITASGGHSLDKQLDYNLSMEVPARYLGGDISKLLAKLDPKEAATTTVTIPVGITGNFLKPAIAIDTKGAVHSLTQRLIEKQKQDLKDKGTDILKDILGGGNVANDSTSTQSNTTKDKTTEVVKDIFGGIFGNKKKKKDTTKTGN
ncbi:MAG: AsmA-like C-terminal region-containing protein, partial [Bacteroidetes bacterium]|nr:AsmA-like C-terminal region-containing protein [Bacteroidota bacterium]